jgi:hypothetical protein
MAVSTRVRGIAGDSSPRAPPGISADMAERLQIEVNPPRKTGWSRAPMIYRVKWRASGTLPGRDEHRKERFCRERFTSPADFLS